MPSKRALIVISRFSLLLFPEFGCCRSFPLLGVKRSRRNFYFCDGPFWKFFESLRLEADSYGRLNGKSLSLNLIISSKSIGHATHCIGSTSINGDFILVGKVRKISYCKLYTSTNGYFINFGTIRSLDSHLIYVSSSFLISSPEANTFDSCCNVSCNNCGACINIQHHFTSSGKSKIKTSKLCNVSFCGNSQSVVTSVIIGKTNSSSNAFDGIKSNTSSHRKSSKGRINSCIHSEKISITKGDAKILSSGIKCHLSILSKLGLVSENGRKVAINTITDVQSQSDIAHIHSLLGKSLVKVNGCGSIKFIFAILNSVTRQRNLPEITSKISIYFCFGALTRILIGSICAIEIKDILVSRLERTTYFERGSSHQACCNHENQRQSQYKLFLHDVNLHFLRESLFVTSVC